MTLSKPFGSRPGRSITAAAALLAAMAACGKDGGPDGPTRSSNGPPTATLAISHAAALAEVTVVEFRASGSDPDGDPVTYSWNFGDGTTASGANATHVYARPGTFGITMTASDNQGHSANVTGTVGVRNLDALWLEAVPFPEGRYGIEITQQGGRFSGRVISPFARATGPMTGTVTPAGDVIYDANYVGFNYSEHFEGRLDAALNKISGTVRGSNGFRYDAQLERQP